MLSNFQYPNPNPFPKREGARESIPIYLKRNFRKINKLGKGHSCAGSRLQRSSTSARAQRCSRFQLLNAERRAQSSFALPLRLLPKAAAKRLAQPLTRFLQDTGSRTLTHAPQASIFAASLARQFQNLTRVHNESQAKVMFTSRARYGKKIGRAHE